MSENEIPSDHSQHKPPDRVQFNYVKSNLFRAIHVDGVLCGLTPSLNIDMSLFIERLPIPEQVVYELNADGELEKEISEERIQRDGVVREVEVSAVIDVETAKGLIELLQNMIEQIEEYDT